MPLSEDLAQEAFVILWEKREQVIEEKAKNFLFTIAANLLVNHHKHQQVVLKFRARADDRLREVSPHYLLEEKEFQQQLEQAIAALPEKCREVFLLNRIDKLTYKAIAASLGISVKAVEKRMHKSLAELRKLSVKI